jgi:hypothetical protein
MSIIGSQVVNNYGAVATVIGITWEGSGEGLVACVELRGGGFGTALIPFAAFAAHFTLVRP